MKKMKKMNRVNTIPLVLLAGFLLSPVNAAFATETTTESAPASTEKTDGKDAAGGEKKTAGDADKKKGGKGKEEPDCE